MAHPNRTFAALLLASAALLASTAWSVHHLLLAGAPTLAAGGGWPGLGCVLLPLAGDYGPHLASYAFLVAILVGLGVGARTLVRQHRQTRALVSAFLAARLGDGPLDDAVARDGLAGRVDVVELAAPVAFCHGYVRPRVVISTGTVALLAPRELEALLLHEREHLRQWDPLKVAVGRLLSTALRFAPIVPALYRRYMTEKELLADRAVVRAQGTSALLAAALVKVLGAGGAPSPALAVGVGGALDDRIAALLDEPLGTRLGPGRRTLLTSTVVGLLLALPIATAPLPSDGAIASHHNVVAVCHLAEATPASA